MEYSKGISMEDKTMSNHVILSFPLKLLVIKGILVKVWTLEIDKSFEILTVSSSKVWQIVSNEFQKIKKTTKQAIKRKKRKIKNTLDKLLCFTQNAKGREYLRTTIF